MPTSKELHNFIFVDFRDSFTYNILAYLKPWGTVKVLYPEQVNQALENGEKRFIWGPGPGRADEYDIDFELLKKSLARAEHRHLGICLGHQLLGLALGGKYALEPFPRHGSSREIDFPVWHDWGLEGERQIVQSYNSLTIELEPSETIRVWRQAGVVEMLATSCAFGCQFHPESVGTSCPERLFGMLRRNFL